VEALHRWLDSWKGIGLIEHGMSWQGYDLQLTRYDEQGWRATFLHERDGALAHERHGERVGADSVAGGAGCGAGGAEED